MAAAAAAANHPQHRLVVAVLVVFSACVADSSPPWHTPGMELVLVERQPRDAACLDGSAPGYWIRRGRGDGNSSGSGRFVFHMQGGGWCWDTDERADNGRSCHYRATMGLGSSKNWSAAAGTVDNWYCCDGLLGSDPRTNPAFHDWTLVFVGYCDGSSFTGTRPGSFNGLRYRGRANLDAVLDHLIEHEGLGAASDVIVTGGSAGGLAVYLNADHIASRLPKVPRTKALADGGFFRDVETTLGVQYARERYSAGLVLWQSSSSLSPTCLAANPGALSWRCIMAQYALPHITVPVFVVEGMYDPWQLENLLQLRGGPASGPPPPPRGNCSPAQLANFQQFGADMRSNISAALHPGKDSAFVPACVQHCQTLDADWWQTKRFMGGNQLAARFLTWWRAGPSAAPPLVDPAAFPGEADCPTGPTKNC